MRTLVKSQTLRVVSEVGLPRKLLSVGPIRLFIGYEDQNPICCGRVFIFLIIIWEPSPLCNDLARFSCAPGNYKDITGSVKSSSDVQKFMTAYAEKSKQQLDDRFKKILDNPENAYFKDLATSGMGLKNSPQCTSTSASDVIACRENLIDGLTTLAQKQTLSPFLPSASLSRMASLSDINDILQNKVYQDVINDLNKQAGRDLSNPEVEKKIKEKIFPEIKSLMIERLKLVARSISLAI